MNNFFDAQNKLTEFDSCWNDKLLIEKILNTNYVTLQINSSKNQTN